MSSTALKVIAAVAVVLALLLAVIGYKVSRGYAEQVERAEQTNQEQAELPWAVVAIEPLAAYKPIARDSVTRVQVAVAPASPYASIDEVVGKVPLVDIDAGAPVTQRYFKEGNVLAKIVPAGFQAVSVEVNDVVAVGGFVRPGDVVDVLLYLRGGSGVEEPQARVLLPDVRVLAYEERIIDRPEGLKGEDGDDKKRSRVRTAVLAVPEAQTTKLMLGASLGELRLALNSQAVADGGDEAAAAASPAATAAMARAPDQAISIAELARIKPPPSDEKKPAPRPKVEIIRGSARETVTTSN